eukprot:TRINITY_DN67692_c3_g11_i2.p1 TRINITY_DN67692_c3_g11~~TRINITY_DN67692_c3_g11_i2.p1  ORF type:complete len:112 (-),score=38.53 TRINITY_DN67692_c3_g11_i2:306-641(-)
MSSSSEISATLIAALKGENDGKEEQSENKLIVVDTSDGCGAKFLIYVVAEAPFQGCVCFVVDAVVVVVVVVVAVSFIIRSFIHSLNNACSVFVLCLTNNMQASRRWSDIVS